MTPRSGFPPRDLVPRSSHDGNSLLSHIGTSCREMPGHAVRHDASLDCAIRAPGGLLTRSEHMAQGSTEKVVRRRHGYGFSAPDDAPPASSFTTPPPRLTATAAFRRTSGLSTRPSGDPGPPGRAGPASSLFSRAVRPVRAASCPGGRQAEPPVPHRDLLATSRARPHITAGNRLAVTMHAVPAEIRLLPAGRGQYRGGMC